MLQNTSQTQAFYEDPDQGLDLSRYVEILKRRIFYILIPFALVISVGFAVTAWLPPIYLSEGKILVESQQIPTDLVRPTVTATAKERIQVIEQRVLTRDNLIAIVNKFQLFPDKRQQMSGTELLDLMRQRTRVQPLELNQPRRANDVLTIAVTIGFEHERPEIAMRVANELVTLILAEDARNRTNRASETTKFLAREVKKLEGEIGVVDAQIAELRKRHTEPASERIQLQLAALKAEFQEKAAVFSNTHPDLIRLKRQIAALEQFTGRSDEAGLEALQNQRTSIQKNLEGTSQKLAAARLGESLERDQFSERLEVLEQAVLPQKPIKPNRPKILAMVFILAMMAGGGAMLAVEAFDKSIRRSSDLLSVADGHIIVALPYISTKAELLRKKRRVLLASGAMVAVLLAGLAAAHFLLRPLDELWAILLVRLLG
jgi:protein tyrosine kinase modulator